MAVTKWLETRQTEVDAGELSPTALEDYRRLARDHVIPVIGTITMGELDRQLVPAVEGLYGSLIKCKLRCRGQLKIEHSPGGRGNNRVLRKHELDGHQCGKRCKTHQCARMPASRLRSLHAVITGTCAMAHRWRWIQENPAKRIKPPKAPKPKPKAPSSIEVAALIKAAFEQGTIVWIMLVTGTRRSSPSPNQRSGMSSNAMVSTPLNTSKEGIDVR